MEWFFFFFFYVCLNKLNKQDVFVVTTEKNLADPATFLASNSVPGTLFSSEDSLFNQLWKK